MAFRLTLSVASSMNSPSWSLMFSFSLLVNCGESECMFARQEDSYCEFYFYGDASTKNCDSSSTFISI